MERADGSLKAAYENVLAVWRSICCILAYFPLPVTFKGKCQLKQATFLCAAMDILYKASSGKEELACYSIVLLHPLGQSFFIVDLSDGLFTQLTSCNLISLCEVDT